MYNYDVIVYYDQLVVKSTQNIAFLNESVSSKAIKEKRYTY